MPISISISISIQWNETIRNERKQKRAKQSNRSCELIWRTISCHVTITSSLASARIFSATFSFFVKLYKNKLRHSFVMATTNRQPLLSRSSPILRRVLLSAFIVHVLTSTILFNYKRVVNAVRSAGKYSLSYVVRSYHFDTAWCTYANSVWNRRILTFVNIFLRNYCYLSLNGP